MDRTEIIKIINLLTVAGYDVTAVKQTLASGLITIRAFPPDKDKRK